MSFKTDKIFDLTIYTPSNVFLESKVVSVTIPSVAGPFQVLVNHAPIIAAMQNGVVKVVDANDKEMCYSVESGITELHNNQLTLAVSGIKEM